MVESLFDSRLVVWAARLLLLSAGFVLASAGSFVVLSILVRARDGDWLKRAGPFEISETNVNELRRQLTYWQATAADLEAQVIDLSEDS